MHLTEPPPDHTEDPAVAAGPPKPAGLPGKWVVIAVVVGCLVITAGFQTVKFVRGDAALLNRATLRFTDGLGALERIVRCRRGIETFAAAGDDETVIKLQEREALEWQGAETDFALSAETGIAPRAATGWLAEVKRRKGELREAERLFDEVLDDRPPPQALNAAALAEDSDVPDPADLGGRALTRAALGDTAGAAQDARRALELSAAGAKTRATDVYAEFAPDPAALRRLAAAAR